MADLADFKENNYMILRQMVREEFTIYRQIVITEYAKDLAESRKCSLEEALVRATKLIDSKLSNGTDTPSNRLNVMAAGESDTVFGYLWLTVSEKTAWVYDIYIHPEWRGKGYGHAALDEMNGKLFLEGIVEIGLRVAENNGRAKKLYEKLGFEVSGFNLSKRLS
ncbi:GNAT family N-acetyltransferase [Serratia fonticola]|uniref:GNAT family N-acetyltransferase n=1 Tax=Serratia fonticola TaxID=47917 RepID=A0AAJ1Y9A6_SERFO|nr:GNAT family N-acetyltransferase [Serratia fonticola]MDQ9126153.1 GNAT family N-acetyltransferase [Serratia fonticola]